MAMGSLGTTLLEEQADKPLKWMSDYLGPGGPTCLKESLQVANKARATHGQRLTSQTSRMAQSAEDRHPRQGILEAECVAQLLTQGRAVLDSSVLQF